MVDIGDPLKQRNIDRLLARVKQLTGMTPEQVEAYRKRAKGEQLQNELSILFEKYEQLADRHAGLFSKFKKLRTLARSVVYAHEDETTPQQERNRRLKLLSEFLEEM